MVIPSILDSVKTALGIDLLVKDFDAALILFINSVFSSLFQIGAGPSTGFSISSSDDVWSSFLGTRTDLEFVKTYVILKVKLMFDPPSNSFLVDAIKTNLTELEFRINVQVTPVPEEIPIEP